MLGVHLDTRIRRTLAVDVDSGLSLAFDSKATNYFAAHIAPPSGSNSTFDGSPRSALSPYTLYWVGAVVQFGACHRVEDLEGTVYELIARPEPVTNGQRTLGYSAPMLPVADLYPRSAEVKALGQEAVVETIECALFSERETERSRGTYRDTFMEAPAAAWDALSAQGNHLLHFADGSEWQIVEATLAPALPFVTAGVRKAG